MDVSKDEKILPLHLLLSARFRVQLAACPGDLENITMEDGCSAWFDLASSAFCCRSWELGGNFKMPQIHGSLSIKNFNPGYIVDWFLTCNPKTIYIKGSG